MNFRRWFGTEPKEMPAEKPDDAQALRTKVADLEERLRSSEATLRERTEALYTLQQHYSSEHFELHESMRNLKIERMRNAGAYAAQDIVIGRYRALQTRIAELKQRLRAHEQVDDRHEDTAPIVLDDPQRNEQR